MDNNEELNYQLERVKNNLESVKEERDRYWRELVDCQKELNNSKYWAEMDKITYNGNIRYSRLAIIMLALVVAFLLIRGSACKKHDYESMDEYLRDCSKFDIQQWVDDNYNVDEIYSSDEIKEYVINSYELEDIEEWYEE